MGRKEVVSKKKEKVHSDSVIFLHIILFFCKSFPEIVFFFFLVTFSLLFVFLFILLLHNFSLKSFVVFYDVTCL